MRLIFAGSFGYRPWSFTGVDLDEDEEDAGADDDQEEEGEDEASKNKKKMFGYSKHFDPVALKVKVCFNLLLILARIKQIMIISLLIYLLAICLLTNLIMCSFSGGVCAVSRKLGDCSEVQGESLLF